MRKYNRPPGAHPEDDSLPPTTGTYALLLFLAAPKVISIARFGAVAFPSGWLIYVGSAFGSGGLRARVGRHLRRNAPLHWHIDWLLSCVNIAGYWYCTAETHLECAWSQSLIGLPAATTPLQGFGASDCRMGCTAHLIGLSASLPIPSITRTIRRATNDTYASVSFHHLTGYPPQG